MMKSGSILWNELKLIILDVDGTLYQQSKLRRIMLAKLLEYYMLRPWKWQDLVILYHFRSEREKRIGYRGLNLEEEQYQWCAEKINVHVDRVKRVVNRWIFQVPNQYLIRCMYPGVLSFLSEAKRKGIKTAVFSDYYSRDKLLQMQIEVDVEISSTDQGVNCFKPDPKGLLMLLSKVMITNRSDCLYIGDRDELDGRCARTLGIPFMLVKDVDAKRDFYHKLTLEIKNNSSYKY